MRKAELRKRIEKILLPTHIIVEGEEGPIIYRRNSKYHFHTFYYKDKFYCERPPMRQIYPDEVINVTVADYLMYILLLENKLVEVLTEDIYDRFRSTKKVVV